MYVRSVTKLMCSSLSPCKEKRWIIAANTLQKLKVEEEDLAKQGFI